MKHRSICLSGSISILPKILEIRDSLESQGIEVKTPTIEEPVDYSRMSPEKRAPYKNEMIRRHLERIKNTEALLVVNEDTKGIKNYIGANTFLEMGIAFALSKPIYILNEIPDQANIDEIRGLLPIELNGDISQIV